MPFTFGNENLCSEDLWDLINGEYEVGDVINCGRDGTIIRRATHHSRYNTVALKVVQVSDSKKRDALAREADLVGLTAHEHVVTYHGAYIGAKEVVLVFECCATDLLDKLNAAGKFTEEQARKAFLQVVRALHHCHSIGVAHRDIKLENIFETADGVLKLGDFGFASLYEKGKSFDTSCGTLSYAAPEVNLRYTILSGVFNITW